MVKIKRNVKSTGIPRLCGTGTIFRSGMRTSIRYSNRDALAPGMTRTAMFFVLGFFFFFEPVSCKRVQCYKRELG